MELLAKKVHYSSLKEQKQEIIKKFLKKDGWMELRHWLTKYTNKESTLHNTVTFHTIIPT